MNDRDGVTEKAGREGRGAMQDVVMTQRQCRHVVTVVVFALFARIRGARSLQLPYRSLVVDVQMMTALSVRDIDHVMMQLFASGVLNMIDGAVVFTALVRPDCELDADTLDWLFGEGRFAQ